MKIQPLSIRLPCSISIFAKFFYTQLDYSFYYRSIEKSADRRKKI